MIILAKTIGILIGGMGVAFIIQPEWAKKVMAFWKAGNRIFWAGVLRVALGAILLLAAPGSVQPSTVALLGILFVAGGVLIFVLGNEEARHSIEFWEGKSPLVLRIVAVFAVVFGALILFAV